jgi:hypothetical protein
MTGNQTLGGKPNRRRAGAIALWCLQITTAAMLTNAAVAKLTGNLWVWGAGTGQQPLTWANVVARSVGNDRDLCRCVCCTSRSAPSPAG